MQFLKIETIAHGCVGMVHNVFFHNLFDPLFLHLALLLIHPILTFLANTQSNTSTELLHTCAINLPGVSSKVVGNKKRKLSGDMTSTFKKLIESLEKIMTLKLELQREAIETTKSTAQSMIAMEERFRKENRE